MRAARKGYPGVLAKHQAVLISNTLSPQAVVGGFSLRDARTPPGHAHSAGPGLCPQRCVALRLTLRVALRVAVVGRNGSKMAPQLIMKRLYFEDAELCILDRLFAENEKSDGFTIVKP